MQNSLLFFALLVGPVSAWAQTDPLQETDKRLKAASGSRAWFTFEERTRWEEKYGVTFGKAVNQQDMLSRLRIGFGYAPADWISIYAMGQDARAPFYGVVAPSTLRDTIDLQEAIVKLFEKREKGFGAAFGRSILDYGESRIIGSPQWSNVSKTFDQTRVYYRIPKARYEALIVSPVKVLPDAFNKPEPGERIWGTYDVFTSVWHGASIDAYGLRHSQNKIGGWTGAGTLGTNTFGGRFYGPLSHGFAYSMEGIVQKGHVGLVAQRAYAWFIGGTQKVNAGRTPLTFTAEYKEASGTKPGSNNSGTFDQLSPANHDKFGHEDLFGWRNLRTFKSLETIGLTKALSLNLMYTDQWLFSKTDSLYNSQGSSIAVSKSGTAGTHVGRELDSILTVKKGAHTFGAGFGHFFKGEFVASATSHINPRYFYVFQQYSFK